MSSTGLAFSADEAIEKMRQKVAMTLAILSGRDVNQEQCRGALDVWEAQLGTLADNTTVSGIEWICNKLVPHVNALDLSTENLLRYGAQLIEWLDTLLSNSQQTKQITLIDKIQSLLPTVSKKEVEIAFDLGTDPVITSDTNTSRQYPELIKVVMRCENTILEVLNSLPVNERQDKIHTELTEAALDLTKKISTMAKLVESDHLFQLCHAVCECFSLTVNNGSHITYEQGQSLQRWLNDLPAYIKNPDDNTIAKKVFSILPEEQRNELLSKMEILLEAKDTSRMEQETDGDDLVKLTLDEKIPESNDQEIIKTATNAVEQVQVDEEDYSWQEENLEETFANDTDCESIDSILEVLSEELVEMTLELTNLLDEIDNDEKDDNSKHVLQYLTLIEQLSETLEALGLTGLQQVCLFISHNFAQASANNGNLSNNVTVLFRAWPDQILDYLKDPGGEENCLSLLNFLQEKDWPEPLADPDTRQLMIILSKEMVSNDFFETEPRQSIALPEDVDLVISDDTNQDLINAFFQEAPKFAAEFSACLEKIARGVDILENIGKAQRFAHTLKGSANLTGIKGIANLTHHMEDILEYLLANPNNFPLPLIQALQEAGDCVEVMIDSLQGKDDTPEDALDILQNVLDWANRIDSGDVDDSSSDSTSDLALTTRPIDESNANPEKSQNSHEVNENSLHVPTRVIDNMFKMVGEMSISTSQLREYLKRLIQQSLDLQVHNQTTQAKRFELEDMVDVRGFASAQHRVRNQYEQQDKFDSLEMDQYDDLHGSIHGFIESVSDSREMAQRIQSQLNDLDGMFLQQQRLNKELEQIVMTTRMIPVGDISSRLQRSVRQTCRVTGKQVKLEISGSDLLLDSDVLNKLTDPIMHMLRNAVDHGIESNEKRSTEGKPIIGNIHLEFLRDGNNLIVNCTDDGQGLDYITIRKTAITNGLIAEQDVLNNAQLAQLIFTPGFSTTDTVTQVSGRGVGMDIVSTTIQALGGTLNVEDAKPFGCTINLRLPISLITSHTIVVRSGRETVAIPSNTLARIIPAGIGEFQQLGDEITYRLDKQIYPTRSFAVLIGSSGLDSDTAYENKTILLVRASGGIVAVTVDQVVSNNELVVKSVGKYVRSLRGVSGVSILGDGSVVPVLDLLELLQQSTTNLLVTSQTKKGALETNNSETLQILIVDDSLSVRKSLSQLVEDAGYKCLIARDGVEALDVLQKQNPSLVLTDLEMPRMTGLELASNIRADSRYTNLPIIMITSRTTNKHHQQAVRVGVNEYLTKPFSEDALLNTMNLLLSA